MTSFSAASGYGISVSESPRMPAARSTATMACIKDGDVVSTECTVNYTSDSR